MNKAVLIRKIYLYLFSFVGLVLITIGCVRLVNLALKAWVFTKADQYFEYPAPRLVKPVPDGEKVAEYAEPSKEEIEEYNRNQRAAQRQRDAAESIAMILVGAPLYLYHWRVIERDKEE